MNFVVQRFSQSWILQRHQRTISRHDAEQSDVYRDHSDQTGNASQKTHPRECELIFARIQMWHYEPVVVDPVHAQDEDSRNRQQDFVSPQAAPHQQKEWNE